MREERRRVSALLIALMWIRCEHRGHPSTPYPPITFQLITVSQALPRDVLARWLACQSELLGSICNLSPVSSFFPSFHYRSLLFLSHNLFSTWPFSHLPLHPGIFFSAFKIMRHVIHLFIFLMIAWSASKKTVYECVCVLRGFLFQLRWHAT